MKSKPTTRKPRSKSSAKKSDCAVTSKDIGCSKKSKAALRRREMKALKNAIADTEAEIYRIVHEVLPGMMAKQARRYAELKRQSAFVNRKS